MNILAPFNFDKLWIKHIVHVYLQYNSIVVDMKRNQKYQSFNKYNISDWYLEAQ